MMRSYLHRRLRDESRDDAWRLTLGSLRPREWSRREVAGAHGQSPVLLTVPIEGGSSVVKRAHPGQWTLSDHGRWRMMHLGALEAAYGTTPFFEHFYPGIHRVLSEAGQGMSFHDFTLRLYEAVEDNLRMEPLIDYLLGMDQACRQRIILLSSEKKITGYADLAFLDVIFRKGQESIFTLLAP